MTTGFVRKLAAAAAMACTAPVASADVLTFDDLAGNLRFFTADYRGFRFGTNNASDTAWFYTSAVSPHYAAHSGTKYVATDYLLYEDAGLWAAAQPISNATAFTFDGAWFTGGDQVRFELYNGNTLVHTSDDSPVLTNVPTFVESGYAGLVTSVVILGAQGYYAMDDFTFNMTPVPEPESYALFLAGLACIGAIARKRRQNR